VGTTPIPQKPKRPTVGLDVPCKKCGKPIYFNYRGPVEGLCGRCTDTSRKPPRFARSRRIGFFESRKRGFSTVALALLAAAVLAAAAFLILGRL
jgi:hypothetical protein